MLRYCNEHEFFLFDPLKNLSNWKVQVNYPDYTGEGLKAGDTEHEQSVRPTGSSLAISWQGPRLFHTTLAASQRSQVSCHTKIKPLSTASKWL